MELTLHLNKDHLQHNLNALAKLHPRGIQGISPIIKSNGYGHGLAESFQALSPSNIHSIGVAYLNEARSLRDLGWKKRILLVTPVFPNQLKECFDLNLEIFITNLDLWREWKAYSHKPKAHIKIDTGLSRQGFLGTDISALTPELLAEKENIVGICSHFANVEDVLEQEFAKTQLETFKSFGMPLANALGVESHFAASAAHILMEPSRLDFSRCGISLFGIWPSSKAALSASNLNIELELKPAMTATTRIHSFKKISAGSFIGYGCTYRAPKNMRVAVLPIGYNEGFIRKSEQKGAYVLIEGQRCKILGRISMNLMSVDVDNCPKASLSSDVILIGNSFDETLTAEQWSEWTDTIPYEFLTRLHPDAKRTLSP